MAFSGSDPYLRDKWTATRRRAVTGSVEVAETFIGGKAKNEHAHNAVAFAARGDVGEATSLSVFKLTASRTA